MIAAATLRGPAPARAEGAGASGGDISSKKKQGAARRADPSDMRPARPARAGHGEGRP